MTSKKPIKLKTSVKSENPDQTETFGQTEDDASEIYPANDTRVFPPFVSATLHERIAARAFENYERRIRQGPLDDWLQAEQEILGRQ
ncbi:MAG: DUF2934 domain-containing protein [Nitrospira sp.]|nr:DUF2934 domain-containing protein [Nitrospira sp.]